MNVIDTSDEEVKRVAKLADNVVIRLIDGERFSMRVPAEPDRDMDLIIARAGVTLRALLTERASLRAQVAAAREGALREIAKWCRAQQQVYLDPRYAVNQPASSFGERHALAAVIDHCNEMIGAST